MDHWVARQTCNSVRTSFTSRRSALARSHSSTHPWFHSELYSNQLSGTISSTIGLLINLQYLYDNSSSVASIIVSRSFVCIIAIDDPIGSYLDYNQLTGTIPSTIGSLTNLQELYGHPPQPLQSKRSHQYHQTLRLTRRGSLSHNSINRINRLFAHSLTHGFNCGMIVTWMSINSQEPFHRPLDPSSTSWTCTSHLRTIDWFIKALMKSQLNQSTSLLTHRPT